MSSTTTMEKSFLEKLQQYLINYPGRCCDVTFLVGPQKEVITTSRIILEIVCPAFVQLFDEKWGNGVGRDSGENGIPLPEVDPKAFQLFLKLLIFEDVSVEALEKLNLAPTELLNVTELCFDYKMTTIHQNLQVLISRVVFKNDFSTYSKTDDFLKLSQRNIKTMLSSDELLEAEAAIMEAALKWAEFQCSEQKIANSEENLLTVLGDALFQLRFPTMSPTEFIEYTHLQDLLTEKEHTELLRFVCQSDVKNTKHAVGFLGPLDSDSHYDVTVEIKENGKCFAEVQRQVSAKRNKNFYVFFDSPITIEPTNVYDKFSFRVLITIKGPNTPGIPAIGMSTKDLRIVADGVGFWCRAYSSPLTEFLFRKC